MMILDIYLGLCNYYDGNNYIALLNFNSNINKVQLKHFNIVSLYFSNDRL